MRRTLKAIGATLGLLFGVSTYAQGYAPPPPAHYYRDPTAFRHVGFYLHFDTGPAYLSSSFTNATVSGPGWAAGASLGGALSENLILAADLFGVIAVSPTVTYSDGYTQSSPGDYSLSLGGIGPELIYYFMPGNVYVSGTLAFTRLSESQGGIDYASSDVGIGGRISVGKEWFISPHLGLGIAGQILFSSNRELDVAGSSTRISTWGAGVNFSASFD